ncbi:MAG: hypothetical protein RL204_10 [Bacteroidota bacterium]|jgi:hypothetical protein
MRYSAFIIKTASLIFIAALLFSCTIEKRRYMNGYNIQPLSNNKEKTNDKRTAPFLKNEPLSISTTETDTTTFIQASENKTCSDVLVTTTFLDTIISPNDSIKNEYSVPFSPKKLFKKSSKNAVAGLGIAALGYGTTTVMTLTLEEFFAVLPFFNILFISLGAVLLGLWIYALIIKISLRKKTSAIQKDTEDLKHYTHESSSMNFPKLDRVAAGLLYTLYLMILASILTLLFVFLSPDGLSFPQKMIVLLGYSAIAIQLILIAFCAYKIWKFTQATKNSRIDR